MICPHCEKVNRDRAEVCRFCSAALPETLPMRAGMGQPAGMPDHSSGLWVAAIIFGSCVGGGWLIGGRIGAGIGFVCAILVFGMIFEG